MNSLFYKYQMKERNRGVSAQLNSSHSSVTQPVGDGRNNSRRMEQIETLHLQFEDLKKKIKDVETKNEEIISNIHKRYDFKKKPQTMQYVGNKSPIVYYEKPQDKSQLSVDNQSNNSNESQCEFKIQKPLVKKTSNIKKNINPSSHHQSMEYRKTQHNTQQRQPSQVSSSNKTNQNHQRKNLTANQPFGYGSASQFRPQTVPQDPYHINQFSGLSPYQMSMQFPPYPSNPVGSASQVQGFYGGNNNYQYQEIVRREKEKVRILQKQLQQKEGDTLQLKRLQKKYNNLSLTYGEIVETSMEEFMEEVVKKKLYEIQKFVKKNQNKLRKLHLMIKDKEEQNRSIRNIEEHRFKRSISRSKKQLSPKNASISLPRDPRRNLTSHQSTNLNVDSSSASKSKQSEQSKSSMKFQQIAKKYEQMIQIKNKDLEISQQSLRQKERQLGEMTMKCSKLQLKVAELEQDNKLKSTKSLDKEQNLLGNSIVQSEKDRQIRALSRKLVQFEELSKKRQTQAKEKDSNIDKLTKKLAEFQAKSKRLDGELKLLKEDRKRGDDGRNKEAQLQVKLRRLQTEMIERNKECSLAKDKCARIENQKIECQCENLTLGNRVKKLQSLLIVRDEKIQELQKIIQSSGGMDLPDLLQRSMTLEKMDINEMHSLQEEKEKLEDLLNQKQEQLYTLQRTSEGLEGRFRQSENQNESLRKEIEILQIQNQSMRINLKALQFEKYSVKNEPRSPLQKFLLQDGDCLSEHQEANNLREELEDLRNRYEQSQRLLKMQKQQSLDLNSKLIKANSELRYYRQLLTQRQSKYEKLRKEHEESRYQTTQLEQSLQAKETELMQQKRLNHEKLMDLEGQLLQLETGGREHGDDSNNLSELRQSRNFSEQSFANYRSTFNNINAQNEHLVQKLKEAQKIIEIQKQMEGKIMSQYRGNVDKIKGELREKAKQNEQLLQELEGVKRRVKVLEQNESRLKQVAKGGAKDQLLGLANERASQLEVQVAELREINHKMAEMEQELLKQVAEKQTENQSLVRLIHSKERKIEELEDIIELKQMNISSHITTSNQRSKIKESQQSQSSLRYSILSNNVVNKDRTMELQLSEAGESFFQNNQSMISNVSEVFGRDEFPYQKMQLRRVEQRRLFEKTAAYIKSLKHAIEQKNKKIKLLEKKIESLRNSELIRKDIYEMKENLDFEPDDEDVFRDYYSVQLENTHANRYKLKQLEHQTKLTIEENNLLNNQIESLQEELLKAEDQENSLMKLKDLYKDQIKTLIKKNQEQAKAFEDELKREKQKVEMSESVQKMEAEKQLFVKIVNVIIILQNQGSKSKKKQDRKRQLAQYIKIFFNFVNVEQPMRQKMLADLKR